MDYLTTSIYLCNRAESITASDYPFGFFKIAFLPNLTFRYNVCYPYYIHQLYSGVVIVVDL